MLLPPLTNGRIIRRYQRFLADVMLEDGHTVTAHCPNTGSMRSCWEPNAPVQLSYSSNPARKLAWTLERVDMGGGWVGVHTGRVNAVIAEAISAGRIPTLKDCTSLRQEVTVNFPGLPMGRLDIGMYAGDALVGLIEVKNVTWFDGLNLKFPDAVTKRGLKHLDLLLAAHNRGLRAVMLFAINRPEGEFFAPAADIDPIYAQRLAAVADGVEILAVRLQHGIQDITVGGAVAIRLPHAPR